MNDASKHWLRLLSDQRLGEPERPDTAERRTRTAFQRDYDRIVFSTAFRRLSGKTQVFPLPDNDAIHSRLTHSLEVSCVGRSLGTMVGEVLLDRYAHLADAGLTERSIGDIVAAACLAHDIGNPPFGHAGEDAIGRWFRAHPEATEGLTSAERADLEKFEGNAQGFRILTRLQIPRNPGLRLTFATLAAFTKYPRPAGPRPPAAGVSGKKHGFFQTEAPFFAEVANRVGLAPHENTDGQASWQRHPLAFLVEAADDICYCILDLEDGFRLGLVPYELVESAFASIASRGERFTPPEPYTDRSNRIQNISYLRAKAINVLAHEVRQIFVELEEPLLTGQVFKPLKAFLPSGDQLEAITSETIETCYKERSVLEIELAGYEVLSFLLDEFVPAARAGPGVDDKFNKILALLPETPTENTPPYERLVMVTDYLSGMTDSFAVSLFRRLRGINLPSRF